MQKELDELEGRVTVLEVSVKDISKAFIKNDLGEPDYDGHRKKAKEVDDAEGVSRDIKVMATKQLIQWVFGLILTAIAGLSFWKSFL